MRIRLIFDGNIDAMVQTKYLYVLSSFRQRQFRWDFNPSISNQAHTHTTACTLSDFYDSMILDREIP